MWPLKVWKHRPALQSLTSVRLWARDSPPERNRRASLWEPHSQRQSNFAEPRARPANPSHLQLGFCPIRKRTFETRPWPSAPWELILDPRSGLTEVPLDWVKTAVALRMAARLRSDEAWLGRPKTGDSSLELRKRQVIEAAPLGRDQQAFEEKRTGVLGTVGNVERIAGEWPVLP